MSMTRLVVTKLLSSSHKGDLAIAVAMLDRLRMLRPDWKLTLLCRDPERDQGRFCAYGTVGAELFAEPSGGPSRTRIAFRLLHYALWSLVGWPRLDRCGCRFVETAGGADALVFCGGGSPGGYGTGNLVLHAVAPLLLARRLRKRVVFTGLGVEPVGGLVDRALVRWVLNQAHAIGARDADAARTIHQLGVRGNVVLTADWAVSLRARLPEDLVPLLRTHARSPDLPLIGLNLRAENARGPTGQARKGPGYRTCVKELVAGLLKRTAATLFVVSMTRSRRTDDHAFALAVREGLPSSLRERFVVLPADLPPDAIKGVVGAMSIFISTRLHPTIFAVSEGVPVLALHDLRKVGGFMAYCGLSEWYVSPTAANSVTLLAKALWLLEARPRVAEHIRARLPALRRAVDQNVELIEQALS